MSADFSLRNLFAVLSEHFKLSGVDFKQVSIGNIKKSITGDAAVVKGSIINDKTVHKYKATIVYVFNEYIITDYIIHIGIETPSE